MSKSFEEKLKDRLQDYGKQPPTFAKGQVFETLGGAKAQWYDSTFQIVGALLFVVAIFQIGKKRDNTAIAAYPDYPRWEEERLSIEPVELMPSAPTANLATIPDSNFEEFSSEDNRIGSVKDEYFGQSQRNYSINEGTGFGLALFEFEEAERHIFIHSPKPTRKETIVPKKKKFFTPYYNLGSYFIYNRVKPNLSDDIYVGEYDAPFGLSASRLGLNIEAGLQAVISEKWSTRVGLSFNNYAQNYSFTVRDTAPDELSSSETFTGFFEPAFETENVQISQRVSTVGAKGQLFWHVFPSKTNVLFTSLEYHQLLGKGPEYEYEDVKYTLMQPRQFLIELGLRKSLYEFRNADLFVMPSLRYGVYRLDQQDILSVKPFSVGVTISYGLR